ncbi:MAG: insulinase family protein [Candidatus Latescibacterota bacterium]|nr:MAG: insulinase family protein [Candidatus Latescibacterota bacterium]
MISTSSTLPRAKRYVGDNGVTVLHQDNPFSRAFCIGVWVKTGSRDETVGEEGLSHFLEHMLFKGTSNRSAFEISQAIEKVGGSLDAFTTKEQICVYAQVLNSHADLAVDILDDMFLNPAFAPAQIELEKQVILEEIQDVMDSPDDVIHDLFASEVFAGHPLGKPILGTPESVASFDVERLTRYAGKSFRADNVVVSVFGSARRRLMRRIRDEAFRFPTGTVKRGSRRLGKYEPSRRHHRRKLHHQHLCIGGRACSYLDDKRFALGVLTALLGGGMSSRLFQRIREELGFAYSVFTYTESARDSGLIGTYMAVSPTNAGRAVREVFRELKKIKNGEVSGEELHDTKEQLKGKILLGLETSSARMMRIARNEIYYGRQIGDKEIITRINRVSRDDLFDCATDVLDSARNTIVSLGPSSSGLGITRV